MGPRDGSARPRCATRRPGCGHQYVRVVTAVDPSRATATVYAASGRHDGAAGGLLEERFYAETAGPAATVVVALLTNPSPSGRRALARPVSALRVSDAGEAPVSLLC
ncbi:hypothetical protein GCM10023335_75600 [Streptomyces siamensis]|uniref:Uncharacterized protein n=1 Tax=Streptomyces siamensis TaxID=1274986 RepID=A0ABP9JKG9_9ACTN